MAGQDAVNVAAAFGETLPLSGVILTKADGDARGGAALSVQTGHGHNRSCFLGTGEDLDGLEACSMPSAWPRASSVWAMCSAWSRKSSRRSIATQAEKLARKVRKGQGLRSRRPAVTSCSRCLAWAGSKACWRSCRCRAACSASQLAGQVDEKQILRRQIAVINSMTPQRAALSPRPSTARSKRRIAAGAGLGGTLRSESPAQAAHADAENDEEA